MAKIGLVLEGGGMRGLYTAGVLDFLLQKEILFPYIIGVSAGACHAASYISRQFQRNYRINTLHLKDKRYMSLYNLIHTGSYFGNDMLFNIFPNQIDPFDYAAFRQYQGEFWVVATDCNTGQPAYFQVKDLEKEGAYQPIQASISLPWVARMTQIGEHLYLDGGLSDPIPVQYALASGCEKCVVVLTRHQGYRKEPSRYLAAFRLKYRHFPALVETIARRYLVYNATLDTLKELEAQGKVFILRPQQPITISRFEKNKERLQQLYHTGFAETAACYDKLTMFLESV